MEKMHITKSSSEKAKQELVELCKYMIPLLLRHYAGTTQGDMIIEMAESAIAHAEKTGFDTPEKRESKIKKANFGQIGYHHDFMVVVNNLIVAGLKS